MKENYFEEIRERFIGTAIVTNNYAIEKDVIRNRVSYGRCISWGQVLRDMGHEISIPVQEKDGVLKIPFLGIDGKNNRLLLKKNCWPIGISGRKEKLWMK